MNQRKRVRLVFFLVGLFVTYCMGRAAFLHIHYIDGVMVAHSHPFSHSEHHTHSTVDFTSIDRLTGLQVVLLAFFTFLAKRYRPVLVFKTRSCDILFQDVALVQFPKRGPPYLF
ncbi:hypothetical protein [Bacteroides propionicifaciens]|uniref:hypothetical protein n=1 Tax=Bacteroides propionicifaciens TaxID=392838 RepID=UPI0012DF0F9E|nr:hypothetical protein [Bacteroides propionicifaciens]